MKSKVVTTVAMIALLACSACGNQPTKASFNQASAAPQLQLVTDIRWDEVTAAQQAAKVNNTGLIMMR